MRHTTMHCGNYQLSHLRTAVSIDEPYFYRGSDLNFSFGKGRLIAPTFQPVTMRVDPESAILIAFTALAFGRHLLEQMDGVKWESEICQLRAVDHQTVRGSLSKTL